jgi:uncharacterized repeat protein (TIGR03847 family)
MEQNRIRYPLGPVASIKPESFGEAGQRTFRLALEAGRARCSIWLEKEQLFHVGVYLQEVIGSLSSEDLQGESLPGEQEWSGESTSIEMKPNQISLNHDGVSNSIYFLAYESNEPESVEEPKSVSFWITVSRAITLTEEILRICAAGRPQCFLCKLPINPDGHVCPQSNGHSRLKLN